MRQRSLVASTKSSNEMVSGSVESQYLVGVASPSGHSISSHSFFGFLGCSLFDATATRTRAKREDNQSFVPSRHLIVRQAFAGNPRASFLTGTLSRGRFFDARPGRMPGFQTKVCGRMPAQYVSPSWEMPARSLESLPYPASNSTLPRGSPALQAQRI